MVGAEGKDVAHIGLTLERFQSLRELLNLPCSFDRGCSSEARDDLFRFYHVC